MQWQLRQWHVGGAGRLDKGGKRDGGGVARLVELLVKELAELGGDQAVVRLRPVVSAEGTGTGGWGGAVIVTPGT